MPRSKHEGPRQAEVNAPEVWQHRELIEAIIRNHVSLQLTEPARRRLVDDLVDAAGFALAGLVGVVRGKRARPRAWALDILLRDVSDALLRAGVASTMNPHPDLSRAQSLAKEIAEKIGVPGHSERGVGNLFHQAQRAKEIEKTRRPNVLIEYQQDGDAMVVTVGGPEVPLATRRKCC